MAVGLGTAGTIVAVAAQTISPAHPAGITAGDGLLLLRSAKPDTTVLVTPDGWTLLREEAGGLGVFGNDTGPCRQAVYWRQADGSETGTVACTTNPGTHDIQQAVINRYTKSSDTSWNVAAGGGVDNIASVDWTVTSSPALDLAVGDVVQVGMTWPTDSARTWSAESLTASGATIGVLSVPLVAAATGLGADMATRLHAFTVTAGSSSAGPTFTGTVNSASNVNGVSTFVRLREVGSAGSSVTLTSASLVLTARPLSATPGVVAVALSTAGVGLTAQQAMPLPGAVGVTIQTAGLNLLGVPLTAVPGSVTVGLTPANVALAGGSVNPGVEAVAARGAVGTPARSTVVTPARSGVRVR